MNKTAIRNFAIWARNKLIADVSYKAGLMGITSEGISDALFQSTLDVEFYDIGTAEPYAIRGEEIKQRKGLVDIIRQKEKESDYATAYSSVVEEVAYTWFNRLIAVRFMEVNDYMPAHIRVLSSETGKLEPDIVTNPFDADLELSESEKQQIIELKNDNKLDECFRMLFIKQCNTLYSMLPRLFENTSDYSELLLNVSFVDQDGVIYHLVHDIEEDDFNIEKGGQVEIIGWLYQYYISEPKDDLINSHKQYRKRDISFVTQLFTSDWIVKYMVQNSLGKLWLQSCRNTSIGEKWEYYIGRNDNAFTNDFLTNLDRNRLESIRFIDPCMGSGHILAYAFDIFMEMYISEGYSERDAASLILENNLFGLDIDERAAQLSYFSLFMKARKFNRRILDKKIDVNVYSIKDSRAISEDVYRLLDEKDRDLAKRIVCAFNNADVIGSLITINEPVENMQRLSSSIKNMQLQYSESLLDYYAQKDLQEKLLPLIEIAIILARKYDVVVTNPPYLNSSLMPNELKAFINSDYSEVKNDLFSAFTKRTINMCKDEGYIALLMPYVWMFISSFEKMREFVYSNVNIDGLVQLEYNAFEAACVPVATTVMKKTSKRYAGRYIKLSEFPGSENQGPKTIEAINNPDCEYSYEINQNYFKTIYGAPVAYWLSEKAFNVCKNAMLFEQTATTRAGMITGNNDLFIRIWFEVNNTKMGTGLKTRDEAIASKCKWFPYNKGGEYRKWYGNNAFVVNWENDGFFMRNLKDEKGKIAAHAFNLEYIFKENVTWSSLSSYKFGARYTDYGFLYDASGSFADVEGSKLFYTIGFLCSCVVAFYLEAFNPTLNFQKGNISTLPYIFDEEKADIVERVSKENVHISKADWDSFETSWDFKKHPLI